MNLKTVGQFFYNFAYVLVKTDRKTIYILFTVFIELSNVTVVFVIPLCQIKKLPFLVCLINFPIN